MVHLINLHIPSFDSVSPRDLLLSHSCHPFWPASNLLQQTNLNLILFSSSHHICCPHQQYYIEPLPVELTKSIVTPLSLHLLKSLHPNLDNLPKIPPTYTPNVCKNQTLLDQFKWHKMFGCWKFKAQFHLIAPLANAKLISGGKLPLTLGFFITKPEPLCNNQLPKRYKNFKKVPLILSFETTLH